MSGQTVGSSGSMSERQKLNVDLETCHGTFGAPNPGRASVQNLSYSLSIFVSKWSLPIQHLSICSASFSVKREMTLLMSIIGSYPDEKPVSPSIICANHDLWKVLLFL